MRVTMTASLLARWRRFALALTFPALLGGCGFQPLYGTPGYSQIAGVEIDTGSSRLDYLVADALEEEFGAGRSPYRLTVNSSSRESAVGVAANAAVTRYELTVSVRYSLERSGQVIASDSEREILYFPAPANPYGLIAARRTAEEQAAAALARRVSRAVALALREEAGEPGS